MKYEKKAAILVSRQPLRPHAGVAWVDRLVEAIDWIKDRGFTLLTSAGMQTWELAVALAAERQVPQEIVLPMLESEMTEETIDSIQDQFELDAALHQIRTLDVEQTAPHTKHQLMQLRDRAIVDQADALIPISIRPGGGMQRLLSSRQTDIVDRFRCEYSNRRESLAYRLSADGLSDRIRSFGGDYLTHWTRTSDSPWPTETKRSFYRDLIASTSYPRAAFHTLCNILATGTIVASSTHMPHNTPCVSLTSHMPADMLPHMRWRARYRQMSFEPYGIALRRDEAIAAGALPVIYYDRDSGEAPSEVELWRSQSEGQITNWTEEQEYRHRGDVDLSQFDQDSVVVFCLHSEEAAQIESRYGVWAISFL